MLIILLAGALVVGLYVLIYALCQMLRRQHEEMDKWTRQ